MPWLRYRLSSLVSPHVGFRLVAVSSLAGCILLSSCGGGGTPSGGGGGGNTPTITSVIVTCTAATVSTGKTLQCTPTVTGTGNYSSTVTWAVNGTSGGNATYGAINTGGLYQAPPTAPAAYIVTVSATSSMDSTKSGSFSVLIAGTIASASQPIKAAAGGTISLPGGNSATIPAGVLNGDSVVTLQLTSVATQPTNTLFSGIGPSLLMSFSPAIGAALSHPLLKSNATSGTSSITFILQGGQGQSGAQLQNSLAVLDVNDGTNNYFAVPSTYDSSLNQTTIQVDPSMVEASSTLTVGLTSCQENSLGHSGNAWLQVWNLSGNASFSDAPSGYCPSGSRTLVMVHGMLSSPQETFGSTGGSASCSLKSTAITNGSFAISRGNYGTILGIQYQWWDDVDNSAQSMATILNSVFDRDCPYTGTFDIEAHSEGTVVSLQSTGLMTGNAKNKLKHIVLVAGPIDGTPVAQSASEFLTLTYYLNLQPAEALLSSILMPASHGDMTKFVGELTPNSAYVRDAQAAAQLNVPYAEVIAAGGDNPQPDLYWESTWLNNHVFLQGQPNDGIVPVTSSLPQDSVLPNLVSLFCAGPEQCGVAYPFNHTHLVNNAAVMPDILNGLNGAGATAHVALSIAAQSTALQPGESTTLTATTTNILNPQIQWSLPGGSTTGSLSSSNGTTVQYVAPQSPGGPYQVSAEVPAIVLSGSLNPLSSTTSITVGQASNPLPTITSLLPSALAAGATPQTLTINGTGFLNSSTVTFNGISHTDTFVNASQLTISLTSTDLATVGSFPVVVSNPAPGGGSSSPVNFTVTGSSSGSGEWTWMGGSIIANSVGVYGTQGTPAAGNIPGGRDSANGWVDNDGNFWLFAGEGAPNDLWKFSPSTNEWTWIGGSSTGYPSGVYGTMGTPAAGNIPGVRYSAASWTDTSGHLWLFGGWPLLNDLWEYYPSTNQWAWMGGSNTTDQLGVYGSLGTPASGNTPGSRSWVSYWTDGSGNFWLFGGYGYPALDNLGTLDDLWMFNPSMNQWAWVGGTDESAYDVVEVPGIYGALGAPAAGNIPGARYSAASWADGSGHLWLFGGDGDDVNGNGGALNDLWEYYLSTNEWAWMGGSNTNSACGVYGPLGVPTAGNVPGSRSDAIRLIDSGGDLWLFGGADGCANDTGGPLATGGVPLLNDLWEYNPSTNQWTWMGGNSSPGTTGGHQGVYGTLGTPAPGNVPGSRMDATSWRDSNGNLWLFGGLGYDANGSVGELNDLWRFQPPSVNPAPTVNGLIPTFLQVGSSSQTLEISGTSFLPSSVVTFNGISHTVTYFNSGQLSIGLTTADLSAIGNFPVVVTNPTPGGGAATSVFTVSSTANGMIISPSAVTVPAGATQTFIASPPGGGTVTWGVQEGAAGGSVTSAGIYTAPGTTGTFHVVAINSANSAQTATATVTVVAATSYTSISISSINGSFPTGSLVQGSDGNLYGTSAADAFRLDSSGSLTLLASLPGSIYAPISTLIQASDNNYYGVASGGDGSIFKMDSSGNVTTMYSFPSPISGTTSGLWPWASLVQGTDGNFYGTTYAGGSTSCKPYGYGIPAYGPFDYNPSASYGCGTIYKMDSSGNVTILYSFSGQSDGNFPQAPLIQGSDGNFYGTTSAGGTYRYGTVFKISSLGNLETLHSFSSSNGDSPVAALIQASDGNLYGTAACLSCGPIGIGFTGEVFRIDPSGNSFTVLHHFSGPDGSMPVAPLIQGSDGNFYGTTWAGGDLTCGSWYWGDGSNYPYSRLGGCGTVFRMDSAGNVTVLHSFEEPQSGDGNDPYAGLLLGKDGNLYGTTYYGGTSVYFGTVFRLGVPGVQ